MSRATVGQRRPFSPEDEKQQVSVSVGGPLRPSHVLRRPPATAPEFPFSCRSMALVALLPLLLLAYLFVFMNLSAFLFGVTPFLAADWQQPCQQLSGVSGAEDFAYDARTNSILLSAANHRSLLANKLSGGAIYRLSLDSLQVSPMTVEGYSGTFHPHGIDLLAPEQDQAVAQPILFVVNHNNGPDSVLRFTVDWEHNRLVFLSQAIDAKFISINDIAAIDSTKFYVTNDNGHPRRTLRHMLGMLAPSLAGSSVVLYNGHATQFVAEARMANGIALSLDRQYVYIAETMRQGVTMYRRNVDHTLSFFKFLHLGTSVDNIYIDPTDQSLWIGCHPSPISFTAHALTREHHHAPNSPSQVIQVSHDLSASKLVLMSNGQDLSASSAAARIGNKLIVTPVFDDHILICHAAAAGGAEE